MASAMQGYAGHPVNRAMDIKDYSGKDGGPRRMRGSRLKGLLTKKGSQFIGHLTTFSNF
jgi:hypothetical protein